MEHKTERLNIAHYIMYSSYNADICIVSVYKYTVVPHRITINVLEEHIEWNMEGNK